MKRVTRFTDDHRACALRMPGRWAGPEVATRKNLSAQMAARANLRKNFSPISAQFQPIRKNFSGQKPRGTVSTGPIRHDQIVPDRTSGVSSPLNAEPSTCDRPVDTVREGQSSQELPDDGG